MGRLSSYSRLCHVALENKDLVGRLSTHSHHTLLHLLMCSSAAAVQVLLSHVLPEQA